MRIHDSRAVLACFSAIAALAAPACGVDTAEEPTLEVQQGAIGTNPKHDAFFIKNLVPHFNPGTTIKDIAVSAPFLYLLRSDGGLERWKTLSSPVFDSALGGTFGHIGYVPLGPGMSFGMLGTNESTRKILYNVQLGGTVLGSWPADATSIGQIGGAIVAGGLRIYIVRNGLPPGPQTVVQTGVYSLATGQIAWGNSTDYGTFSQGLAANGGVVYAVTSFTTSSFRWWTGASLTSSGEHLFPSFTDHAYQNAATGVWERFAPPAMDFNPSDSNFYGVNPTSTGGQAFARLPKSALVL